MSPDLDPWVPPRPAEELLAGVVQRGRRLRIRQRRRRAAVRMGPLLAVLLVLGGLRLRADEGTTADRVETVPAPTATEIPGPEVTAPQDDPLPPPSSVPSAGGPAPSATQPVTTPGVADGAAALRPLPLVALDLSLPSGEHQAGILRPGAAAPVPITAATLERQWPVLTADGRRVALQSTQDNVLDGVRTAWELYVVDTAGGQPRQITFTPLSPGNGSQWPSWSPDGDRLVANCGANDSSGALCTMRSDGTDQVGLAPASAGLYLPRWSPDSARIVALRGAPEGPASLVLLDPTGRSPVRAVPGSFHRHGASAPDWVEGGGALVVVEVPSPAGGVPRVVRVDPTTGVRTPLPGLVPGEQAVACGPDQILFRPAVPFGPARPGDLVLVGTDGTRPTVVLPASVAPGAVPTSCRPTSEVPG